ncbi:MAG: DNA polymerase III subunit alpha [Planctomycetaceae bacterium]|nr:DNA polymerase III subunit alpha [Planctomycetaceae bacterium]
MPAPRPFVHLHCHSHYSLLDGASEIGALVKRAKDHGMNALAITDHGNLHGALEFYKKARDEGLNPIIGYEAYIAPGSRFERKDAANSKEASYHLTLLAQNRTGFRNLVKLASAASLEGFYYKPRIDKELLAVHSEGLICLSGCVSSELSLALLRGHGADRKDLHEAAEIARWFRDLFGERYFLEIMNNGVEIQRLALEAAVDLARDLGIPLVATSDAHYIDQSDAEAQDVMLCINTGKFRTDTNRMKMENDSFYLRSPEEMYSHFPGLEDAVARSQEIADSVSIDLDLGKRHFPVFRLPPEKTAEDYLRELCLAGLAERYAGDDEMCPGGQLAPLVLERLDRELDVINKLGFPNYFLICWDFVRHAREHGVPATARGSGVGALVCYALYLSHVCPVKYDLLFERFLDLNRIEAPDIDIDFCKDRRGEIIRYVKEKYGEDNVAQIGTFGTLAARAAIKDVGRVLGVPLDRVNKLTAMVPETLGISLDQALKVSDDLKHAYSADPDVRQVLDLARKIEGLARNVGTHAAAVVIADKPLTEYVPLCRVTGKTDIITQWSMGDVEAAGLLKMDFLGLRNLTILSRAVELIAETTGQRIDPYKFPLDDKKTFALLARGETKGIFQLESGGIRDLLTKMKPDHFRDIIATNALYRPGPLEGGMVADYVAVKHGRQQAEYIHPICEKILAETNGVMVYQEQVMRILNELGGIDLASAYTCIKAISKKKEDIIAKSREQFVAGSVAKGLRASQAEDFWNLIIKFAGYGFNKCIVGETMIVHAETGERTTVEGLFHNRRPWMIHALADDGKLHPRRVTDVLWNGRKRVYRLTTKRGTTITATGNHPLRTLDGWTILEDLAPGDRIAAPRKLTVSNGEHWPAHKLIALAGLLSEGNTCHPTCLYFYNNCRELVDDFVEAVEQFPASSARVSERGPRFEVCVSTGRDARFRPGQTPWNARLSSTDTAVAEPRPATRSGAFAWAKSMGILGLKAAAKRLPGECFALCDQDLELLLGRLWSGDGFVGASGQMPYYATSSAQLARDVQLLLLRLGIVSRVHAKLFRYRYRGERRERPGYTVHVIGSESVANFLRRVTPHALGREPQVTRFREYLNALRPDLTSKDTVPGEVRRWIDEERRAAGLTWDELEVRAGVSMKEFVGRGSKLKRGFRRSTMAKLAKYFSSPRLLRLAESDLYWDTVCSIEPAGIQDTYDLTVDRDHNFVADGFVVHNSHSTAYALIAYMTAYLKAHWPVEFMAALLSGDIQGRNFKTKDSLVEHLEDCERMGIEVLPPDVNRSQVDFAVVGGKIQFALSAIKGCGGSAGEAIATARKAGGPFQDLYDFCERVDSSGASKATIETLIKAGAFDSFGARRAQLAAIVDRAVQAGQSLAADKRSGQKSLFGGFGGDDEPAAKSSAALPDVPEWPDRERAQKEKEVLGFYLTSHPLDEHKRTLATYCSHTTADIPAVKERDEVILGGMLSAIKFSNTKNPQPGKPSRYAMFDLEDVEGTIRCILWPEQFADMGHLVTPDRILVVRGVIDRRGGDEANLIVNELIELDQLDSRYTTGIVVRVREDQHGPDALERLREVVRTYPGNSELQLLLMLDSGSRVYLKSHRTRLSVTRELRDRLDDLLGPGNLQLITSPPKPAANQGNGRRQFQRAGR